MEDEDRHRQMIASAIHSQGFSIESWDEEDGRPRARVTGEFIAIEDDEDEGIFEGDTGVLYASVVGAQRYHNERVWFGFMVEDTDVAVDVRDLDILDHT